MTALAPSHPDQHPRVLPFVSHILVGRALIMAFPQIVRYLPELYVPT